MSIFRGPQCMIYTDASGKLAVKPTILNQLHSIEKDLVVVAIAGLYRTGKSYLLNRLAGRTSGFPLGSTVQSKTKGIWIWLCDHPLDPNKCLVLLDTEGLGDAEKTGNKHHDNCIFALTTLLCSTLVFNALNVIDGDTLEKLNFVAEISKHIRTKAADSQNDRDFDFFFPNFIFALRDFYLDLVIDGKPVTSDEYLEHCLKLKNEDSVETESYNKPRRCIRKYFKNRKCFVFDRPAERSKLKALETVRDTELSQDFVKDVEKFVEFVHGNCPLMRLPNRQKATGRMFARLVTSYVAAIRRGAVPCVEDAVTNMARLENEAAVEEAVKLYCELMQSGLQLPTRTDKELTDHHFECLQKALKLFIDKSVMDTKIMYQKVLNEKITIEMQNFMKANIDISTKKCRLILSKLELTLVSKLRRGQYAKSGGFVEFREDLKHIQMEYNAHTDLGLQKSATLLAFLQEKNQDSDAVLAADQKVSEEEKRAEGERQRATDAEYHKVWAERMADLSKEYANQVEKTMVENLKQQQETFTKQQKEIQEHYEKVMSQRLDEQQRLLKEGFKKAADALKVDLARARADHEKEREAQQGFAGTVKQAVGEAMIGAFTGIATGGLSGGPVGAAAWGATGAVAGAVKVIVPKFITFCKKLFGK